MGLASEIDHVFTSAMLRATERCLDI